MIYTISQKVAISEHLFVSCKILKIGYQVHDRQALGVYLISKSGVLLA